MADEGPHGRTWPLACRSAAGAARSSRRATRPAASPCCSARPDARLHDPLGYRERLTFASAARSRPPDPARRTNQGAPTLVPRSPAAAVPSPTPLRRLIDAGTCRLLDRYGLAGVVGSTACPSAAARPAGRGPGRRLLDMSPAPVVSLRSSAAAVRAKNPPGCSPVRGQTPDGRLPDRRRRDREPAAIRQRGPPLNPTRDEPAAWCGGLQIGLLASARHRRHVRGAPRGLLVRGAPWDARGSGASNPRDISSR